MPSLYVMKASLKFLTLRMSAFSVNSRGGLEVEVDSYHVDAAVVEESMDRMGGSDLSVHTGVEKDV